MSSPPADNPPPPPPLDFEEAIAESLAEMRGLLKSSDPRDKVWATRAISTLHTNYKRVQLFEARTNAYLERCRVLNERTSRTPEPTPRNSGVHPQGRAVKTASPNEDELTCPHLTKETERIGLIFMPGPKTKADYESACEALLQREQRYYSELKAAQAELNVYRSERQGLITLDKREELLAGRAEKNARRRERYDVPVFLQELGNVPDWLPIAPKEVPDRVERDENGVPLVPLVSWNPDREGGGHASTHQHADAMSQAHVREGKSRPASHPPSPPSSCIPPCPSVNGACPPGRVVKEILSPLAASRRSAEGGPRTPYTPKRLIHPPPLTPLRPNSS